MTESELIIVFGGRSEIGIELARLLAPGARIILAVRGTGGLEETIPALQAAGATAVHAMQFDADDLSGHTQLLKEAAGDSFSFAAATRVGLHAAVAPHGRVAHHRESQAT
jgi:NAD(P)-dependent dehydrogenase (short-subunit alcohol dehydrogenase family)